jgi:hypothetical protein
MRFERRRGPKRRKKKKETFCALEKLIFHPFLLDNLSLLLCISNMIVGYFK